MPSLLKPYQKKALTFAEQLERLKGRGLAIEDKPAALNALERISSYRLSAYWHPFKLDDDTFQQGSTFEQALNLYETDRHLRLLLLDAIERVEVFFRTAITYRLGHQYGAFAHRNASHFEFPPNSRVDHQSWLKKLDDEVNNSQETWAKHYKATYTDFPHVPIWMASEVMSFGAMSRLFKAMKKSDKLPISKPFNVDAQVVESWLQTVNYVRNVCAHHGRLWNRELSQPPKLPQKHPDWRNNAAPKPRRIYVVFCILRHLTREQPFGDAFARRAVDWISRIASEPRWRDAIGAPPNWQNQSLWTFVASPTAPHTLTS